MFHDAERRLPEIARMRTVISFSDHLDQHALAPLPVELPVEDLLPGAEVELAAGDGDHDLSAHDLALQVRVAVILARPVVFLPADGLMGGQLFQPPIVVLMEARLVVVDEDRRRDVHRVHNANVLSTRIIPFTITGQVCTRVAL